MRRHAEGGVGGLPGVVGTSWFAGRITAAHGDGAFDVAYDDGDEEKLVPPRFIRMPKEKPAKGEEALTCILVYISF